MVQQDKSKRSDLAGDIPSSRISGALVMIALGVIFLLMQSKLLQLNGNWWALVIFIPAAVALYNAYTAYHRDGQVTPAVRSQLSGGLVGVSIGVVAATGQWGILWPLFVIIPGVMLLLGRDQQKG